MRQQPNTLPQSACGPDRSAPPTCSDARTGLDDRSPTGDPDQRERHCFLGRVAGRARRPRRVIISPLMALVLLAVLWLPAPLATAAPANTPVNPEDPSSYNAGRRAAPVEEQDPGTGGPDQLRGEILHYTVKGGDTLYDLAGEYEVSIETLIWANRLEANPAALRLGQELLILPVSGVLHTVQAGDSLSAIATRYKGDVDSIVGLVANHLDGKQAMIKPGQQIIVPGGVKPKVVVTSPAVQPAAQPAVSAAAPADAPKGNTKFIWPVRGAITQRFYYYHPGIDIGDPTGTPVVASDSGYVAVAGWSNVGYGNYVVIDHGNGSRTLYAHLNRIDVKAGQTVQQGEGIGTVGTSGRSTGPHLHFEIHQNGAARNPLSMLP